jgi:hypothetical protein
MQNAALDLTKILIRMTAGYQTRELLLSSYVTNLTEEWIRVKIPIGDFAFLAGKYEAGVYEVNLKRMGGTNTSVDLGLDEIAFTGGSEPFIFYGDAYESSGSVEAVTYYIAANFSILDRPATGGFGVDEVTLPESEVAGGSYLRLGGNSYGRAYLHYIIGLGNGSASWVHPFKQGHHSLELSIKKVNGDVDPVNYSVTIVAGYQTKEVALSSVISSVGSEWTKVIIPISSFGFDAGKYEAGVYEIGIKKKGGGTVNANNDIALDEIMFTGGATPLVYYGDSYESSASVESTTFYNPTGFSILERHLTGGQ